jgi:hypothetical protein
MNDFEHPDNLDALGEQNSQPSSSSFDEDVKNSLKSAVDALVSMQDPEGGKANSRPTSRWMQKICFYVNS